MTLWPRAQLRHIARFRYGDSLAAEDRVDGPVAVFGSNGPVGTHEVANTSAPVFVIGRKGSYGQLNFSTDPVFAIDTTYFVDPATTDNDVRWLFYALSTANLTSLGQDVGVPGLNRELAYQQQLPLPPLAEQRAIADYLDAETARIDALIAKKRQLIHLLEERLRCVADEAVGDLVTSSEMVPLKYLVRESNQRLGMAENPTVLSVSIHHGVVPRSEIEDTESRAEDLGAYKTCEPGQIALNRMRAFQGGVGVVRQHGVVSPDYTVITPGVRVSADYLHFLMRSRWFIGEMVRRLRGIGSTDQGTVRTPRVNYSDLGLIEVPVPSMAEQERLATTLRSSSRRSRLALLTLSEQTKLLRERRQAVITAAVTGASVLAAIEDR